MAGDNGVRMEVKILKYMFLGATDTTPPLPPLQVLVHECNKTN